MLRDLSHGKAIFTKVVLGIVFLLMLASLAMSDVRGVLSGGIGNSYAARLNGQTISPIELQGEMDRMAQRMGVDPAQSRDPEFVKYVLQAMIADKLTEQGLNKLGLHFSDKQVAREVKTLLSDPMNPSKENLTVRYEMALRQSGLSAKQFESTVRTSLAQRLVNESLDAGKLPDPLMANVDKAEASQKRDVVLVTIPVNAKDVKITDEGKAWAQKQYDDNKDNAAYMNPRAVDGRMLILSKDKLAEHGKDDPQAYLAEVEDAFSGTDDVASIVKQYGLEEKKLADFSSVGSVATLTDGLDEGMAGNAIALENGDYGFAVVDKITEASARDYADFEQELLNLWQQKEATEKAQNLATSLKAAKDPMAFAKEEKLTVQAQAGLSPSKELVPLFVTPDTNTVVDLPAVEGSTALRYGFVTKIMPNVVTWKAGKSSIDDFKAAQGEKASTLFADQLLSHWYDTAKITINDKVVQAAGQPVAAAQ